MCGRTCILTQQTQTESHHSEIKDTEEITIGWSGLFETLAEDNYYKDLYCSSEDEQQHTTDEKEETEEQEQHEQKRQRTNQLKKKKQKYVWKAKKGEKQKTTKSGTGVEPETVIEDSNQITTQIQPQQTTTQTQSEPEQTTTKKNCPSLINVFKLMLITMGILTSLPKMATALMSTKQNKQNRHNILLDTGCSNSSVATRIKRFLTNILTVNIKMFTANQGHSTVNEKGKLLLKGVNLDVLHVKDFPKTLISWTDLADLGMTGDMDKNHIKIYYKGELWTTVTREEDRLWHFKEFEDHYD